MTRSPHAALPESFMEPIGVKPEQEGKSSHYTRSVGSKTGQTERRVRILKSPTSEAYLGPTIRRGLVANLLKELARLQAICTQALTQGSARLRRSAKMRRNKQAPDAAAGAGEHG